MSEELVGALVAEEDPQDDQAERHAGRSPRLNDFGPIHDRLTDIEGRWNTSPYDFKKLLEDPNNLADNSPLRVRPQRWFQPRELVPV